MNAKMIADAFALNQGAETEVVDLGKGEYYAIRVERVIPSAAPTAGWAAEMRNPYGRR